MTPKGCECLAEKKYACVSGEKFERTLAHDFEADFFSVVCTCCRTILEINVGT